MNPAERATIGRTGVAVSVVGLGAAPLGGLFTAVDEAAAIPVVAAAFERGLSYIDVAPLYGAGLAEERVGRALAGLPRDSYTLSTKVGRLVVDSDEPSDYVGAPGKKAQFDFSRDAILRSIDESLQRLQLDRVDILYIHDPDDHWEAAVGTAYPTLADLRSQGVVRAIGAGMNQAAMLSRFVTETDIDVVLCAGRYTLLDQSAADELFPECLHRGVSVVMGGVYNSGVLADPYAETVYYDYEPAPDHIVKRARELADLCASHGTPLPAVALQFSQRHPAVTSVLTGVRSQSELTTNLEMATFPVPDALWSELDAMLVHGEV